MVTNVTSWEGFENSEMVNPRCYSELDGGRYWIRTSDFHRVNLTRLAFTTTSKCAEAHASRTRHRILWIGLWIGENPQFQRSGFLLQLTK
jgi:hypothetical protein